MEQENAIVADEPRSESPEISQPEPPRGFLAELTIIVLLLLFGTATLVQAFVIPTPSMEDTLLVGDHLLVDKLAYAPPGRVSKYVLPYTEVKRGDIIVFRYPVDIKQTFVKRCIGLPGDRIHLANKQLILNGRAVTEPYVFHKSGIVDSYRDNFPAAPNTYLAPSGLDMLENHVANGEVVVPPGAYFAMGDNRDNSSDSRYWGFVPRANIVGKPILIYWSYATTTDALSKPGISFDHLIDIVRHFPGKTRWSRTLRLVRGYPLD